MNNISFQSRIRPVNLSEYYSLTSSYGKKCFVSDPWTIKESVLKPNVYTGNVIDCTVCGITDGDKALLMHICPTLEENKNFEKIENFLKEKLKFLNNEYLQGFLLGSQGTALFDSRNLFDNFDKLLNKLNIPTSKFRAGFGETFVAYSSIKDEWLIANRDVAELKKVHSDRNILNEMFDYVEISELDEVV